MQRKKQAKTWIKTAYPGIFYRETIDKNTGNVTDHYYTGWYSVNKKRYQCVFGSKSKFGWTPKKCADKLAEFRSNAIEGKKPRDFTEERALAEQKEAEKAAADEAQKKLEITLKEFWENKYLPEQQLLIKQNHKKPKSVKDEISSYNNWLEPLLGETPLIDIDFNSLLNLKKAILDKGLSVRSIEYGLAVLRQIFNHAIATDDYHDVNPVSKHKKQLKIKVKNAREQWFTIDEFEKIKAELKKRSPTTYTLALLGFSTGGRLGELVQLTWGDIDFEKRFVNFRPTTTKNKEGRYVPLYREIFLHLKKIYDENSPENDSLIITDANGNKVKDLSNTFIKVLEDTGLRTKKGEKMSFHHTRHSFASILAQSGKVTLHQLKEFMGHGTLQMTMRYAHHFPKNEDLIDIFDAIFEQEPETNEMPDNVIQLKKA